MQAGKQHTSKHPFTPPACTAPMASRKSAAALGASTGAIGAPALAIGAAWARGLAAVAATTADLTARDCGDQALVRGLAPRVVDGGGQDQHGGPVHPEGNSLALAPLPDPTQLGPVLQQHQVMRRPKTDAAGVKKQIKCRHGARTDCL